MASVSPISPGAGDVRPVLPVKPAAIALQPDSTSAQDDVVNLSAEAVQLIQASGLSGYENQEFADGSSVGTIPGQEPSGTTVQLVG
ncbi:MAG TPA: hypothetical protein VGM43_21885 [Bryobacteraceae bacterium]